MVSTVIGVKRLLFLTLGLFDLLNEFQCIHQIRTQLSSSETESRVLGRVTDNRLVWSPPLSGPRRTRDSVTPGPQTPNLSPRWGFKLVWESDEECECIPHSALGSQPLRFRLVWSVRVSTKLSCTMELSLLLLRVSVRIRSR